VPRTPQRTRAYYAREEGEGLPVAATTPTTTRCGDGPVTQPCWQCGQKGHLAETCSKLDARLRPRLSMGIPWARPQAGRPTQTPRQQAPPVFPATHAAEAVVESDSTTEEGEPSHSEGDPAPASHSDAGNA